MQNDNNNGGNNNPNDMTDIKTALCQKLGLNPDDFDLKMVQLDAAADEDTDNAVQGDAKADDFIKQLLQSLMSDLNDKLDAKSTEVVRQFASDRDHNLAMLKAACGSAGKLMSTFDAAQQLVFNSLPTRLGMLAWVLLTLLDKGVPVGDVKDMVGRVYTALAEAPPADKAADLDSLLQKMAGGQVH